MRSVIDPETAGFELRPEFEAALDPPPPACPHCRSRAAVRSEHAGGESATATSVDADAPPAACPRHRHRTIERFPRSHHGVGSLPPREQAKLHHIARDILRSREPGCTPVHTVLLVGHADRDPAREQREPGILAKISQARARAVQKALIHLIGDPDVASRIRWIHRGAGDRFPAVPDSQSEDDRARNRRVDVILNPRERVPQPPQPGPVPQPPASRPGPVILKPGPAPRPQPQPGPVPRRPASRPGPAIAHPQPAPKPKPQPQPRPRPEAWTFPPAVIAAAVATHHRWRVPASAALAQWAIVSAFGTRTPQGSNNPFGIKAAGGEPYVEARTSRVVGGKAIPAAARFRKFDSVAQAFDAYGHLLATNGAFARAMGLAGNPDAFVDALAGALGASPQYAAALKTLMKRHNLYQYDKP